MKLQMSSNNKLIAAVLVLAALGVAFWMLLLSPKREEAKKLGAEVEQLEVSLSQHQAEVAEGEAARDEFPTDYQRLVVLGKAVPGDDDIASFLVQLKRIADKADGTFRDISLTGGGGEATEAPPAPAAGAEGALASPTEVAASLLPLGASIGPAGLAVMPYEVTFDGSFFEIADFIAGLDSLVNTGDDTVRVDGRLVTIDGFSLQAGESSFSTLQASFSLTTYLTPPGEGVTGGASLAAPPTATPAATTTGGAP
jgi:Tfp pilus assembly protein PilO